MTAVPADVPFDIVDDPIPDDGYIKRAELCELIKQLAHEIQMTDRSDRAARLPMLFRALAVKLGPVIIPPITGTVDVTEAPEA